MRLAPRCMLIRNCACCKAASKWMTGTRLMRFATQSTRGSWIWHWASMSWMLFSTPLSGLLTRCTGKWTGRAACKMHGVHEKRLLNILRTAWNRAFTRQPHHKTFTSAYRGSLEWSTSTLALMRLRSQKCLKWCSTPSSWTLKTGKWQRTSVPSSCSQHWLWLPKTTSSRSYSGKCSSMQTSAKDMLYTRKCFRKPT